LNVTTSSSGSVPLEIESRALGAGGPQLPRIALGCGNFGGVGSAPALFGQGTGELQALELMDAAWELGITHFDTADAYGGGRSERTIGRWIRERGLRPTLTSKTFHPMAVGADRGLAPARIARQLDSSLERLGVERIELYLAHEVDPEVPIADTLGAFEEARAAGLIAAHGVSNFDTPALEQALAAGAPVAVQNSYSLLHRDDGEQLLALCEARGIAYLAFSPLAGGWLTGKYRRDRPFPEGSRMTQRPEPYVSLVAEPTFDALEALERIASGRGASMAGLALAWLLADPRIAQIVVGPGRPEHLNPVREALAHPLDGGERARIEGLFA
jgi:1-deoxyxylulose-5-phosphate synthase